MSWKGPALDGDQTDLLAMLTDLTADADADSDEGARAQLLELGLWTLGASEDTGGAGADGLTTVLAWERVARAWPATAWASVQAHAALDILADSDSHSETRGAIAAGTIHPAVVVAGGTGVTLEDSGSSITGTVHRVDAGDEAPLVIVVDPRELTALVIDPDAVAVTALETTGLAGAGTASASFILQDAAAARISGLGVALGLARLLAGLAAVTAGVADIAADEARAYASDRRQFGDVLTAIPNVAATVAGQQRSVARVLSQAVSAAHSAWGLPAETGTTDSAERWATSARVIATLTAIARDAVTTAIDVTTSGLQSHGGYGFLTEYPAERRLRDALSLQAVCDLPSLEAAGSEVLIHS